MWYSGDRVGDAKQHGLRETNQQESVDGAAHRNGSNAGKRIAPRTEQAIGDGAGLLHEAIAVAEYEKHDQ